MQYRNTKNGAIININSELRGGDWVPVAPVSLEKKKAPARKRKVAKDGSSVRDKR